MAGVITSTRAYPLTDSWTHWDTNGNRTHPYRHRLPTTTTNMRRVTHPSNPAETIILAHTQRTTMLPITLLSMLMVDFEPEPKRARTRPQAIVIMRMRTFRKRFIHTISLRAWQCRRGSTAPSTITPHVAHFPT